MDRRRLDTVRTQSRDLVVHQCLQWRYDDGGLFEDERRDLIAQRLARSRRHHGQHILPAEDEIDDLLLPGTEGRVAEDIVEDLGGRVHSSRLAEWWTAILGLAYRFSERKTAK